MDTSFQIWDMEEYWKLKEILTVELQNLERYIPAYGLFKGW